MEYMYVYTNPLIFLKKMAAMLRKETTQNIVHRSPKNQKQAEQHTHLQMIL